VSRIDLTPNAISRDGTVIAGTKGTRVARWTLAGGVDVEMADPRLNEEVLRRVARATGGQYLRPDDIARLSSLLSPARVPAGAAQVQELWHNVWIFAAIVALLATEWTLRRPWGLR
jgi:hypothetical protein